MKAYILTLMASSLIVTVASILLPEGSVKKYAHLVSSVIISLSVIVPLKDIFYTGEFSDFEDLSAYEMTKEDAERLYLDNISSSLKSKIEGELSIYGRAYVTLGDNFSVKLIEIYAKEYMDEVTSDRIKELYGAERLEIIYGEY